MSQKVTAEGNGIGLPGGPALLPDGEAAPVWLIRAVAVLMDVAAAGQNPTGERNREDGAFVYPH